MAGTHTLVIDTSFGSTVGIVGSPSVVNKDSRTHVEQLHSDIDTAVRLAGIDKSDIGRIVVGVGPAPFTGLRVGIVAARALAFALHAKLEGIDILSVNAALISEFEAHSELSVRIETSADWQDFEPGAIRQCVISVNDARRKQLYWAFRDDEPLQSGMHWLAHDLSIDSAETIVEQVNARLATRVDSADSADSEAKPCAITIAGHAASTYASAFSRLICPYRIIEASLAQAGPAGLSIAATLACARASQIGEHSDEPLYIRRPDVSVPHPLKRVYHHQHISQQSSQVKQ